MELMWNRPVQFHEFKELINAHRAYEEQSLYPKLDQELSDSQKQEIITKIREIVS